MASLFLIRHGEPDVTGVLLGQMDPPLSSAAGPELSRTLSAVQVEVAWTSPLRRARDTAAYISAKRTVQIAELREIDQGEWTGKTWAQIEEQWSSLASSKLSDWLGISSPGGESWPVFLARIRNAWNVIRAGPSPAAVVGHQGVNAALLYLIHGRDPLAFDQQYGEVMQIEYD